MNTWRVILGNVEDSLRSLPADSVHTCITSPPYWGLRDYGVAGQIGLEETPQLWCARLVEVFREVRRVLRPDGTLWVNLGDSHASDTGGGGGGYFGEINRTFESESHFRRGIPPGLKPKDKLGQPWMVAFALQADGWWLRQDIIWSKPNPMPESASDRPATSHEYVFLLSKSERYHYDAEAVKESAVGKRQEVGGALPNHAHDPARRPISGWAHGPGVKQSAVQRSADRAAERAFSRKRATAPDSRQGEYRASHVPGKGPHTGLHAADKAAKRHQVDRQNLRSVWTIPTQAFPGAHFATFPERLVEPCILAGCPVGGTVLDPFTGSGTTGVVALRLGRSFVGCELNPEYLAMAQERLAGAAPLFSVPAEASAR